MNKKNKTKKQIKVCRIINSSNVMKMKMKTDDNFLYDILNIVK
jgi:hypothetical protein